MRWQRLFLVEPVFHSSLFLGIRALILYRGLMDSAERLHFLTSIIPRWHHMSEVCLSSCKQKWYVRFHGRLQKDSEKCPLLPSLPLFSCLECRHDGQSLWSLTGPGVTLGWKPCTEDDDADTGSLYLRPFISALNSTVQDLGKLSFYLLKLCYIWENLTLTDKHKLLCWCQPRLYL